MVIDIVPKGGLLGLFDLNDFASLVMTALRAGPVRQLGFVTVGALADGACGKVIVRATEGRALLGVSPFRICHDRLPFNFGAAAIAANSNPPEGAIAICSSSRPVQPSGDPVFPARNRKAAGCDSPRK